MFVVCGKQWGKLHLSAKLVVISFQYMHILTAIERLVRATHRECTRSSGETRRHSQWTTLHWPSEIPMLKREGNTRFNKKKSVYHSCVSAFSMRQVFLSLSLSLYVYIFTRRSYACDFVCSYYYCCSIRLFYFGFDVIGLVSLLISVCYLNSSDVHVHLVLFV